MGPGAPGEEWALGRSVGCSSLLTGGKSEQCGQTQGGGGGSVDTWRGDVIFLDSNPPVDISA